MRSVGTAVLALTVFALSTVPARADGKVHLIHLDTAGQVIGVVPAIAETDSIKFCITGGVAAKLTLEYVLRDGIATPDYALFNSTKLTGHLFCDSDAKGRSAETTVPIVIASGRMLAYWVHKPFEADGQAAARKTRLTTAQTALAKAEQEATNAEAVIKPLQDQITQLSPPATDLAVNAILALQKRIEPEAVNLLKAQAAVKAQKNILSGTLKKDVDVDEAPPARMVRRLGAVIVGAQRKTMPYRIVRDGLESQPVRLVAAGPTPVLFKEDELFVVINNVEPNIPPKGFAMTFTSEVVQPPDPAPVRPSVDPSTLGAGASVTEEKALSEAFGDYIIPLGRPVKANEIIKMTISAYGTSVTSDKTTVTDGTAKREVVTEVTNIKVLDAAEYPQVRDRYHFNLTTGVVSTNLREPTFTKFKSVVGATDAETRYGVDEHTGNRRAMAVLLFSFYWTPKDIRAKWSVKDLVPQPTVGFALASPKDDFFAGFQSEIRRNVQLIYGAHFGRVSARAAKSVDEDRNADAVATRQVFDSAGFVGLSFNINFVKELFK